MRSIHNAQKSCSSQISSLLTYTELCLWDSSWHSPWGQDLGLIKQLRLLWQHILASVVSLWISLFSNCFLSTRCWPWPPHSAPATGFSYLLVSHAFALGNWPELFSSPQPCLPDWQCQYLMIPDSQSMPSDWTWPSSFAAPAGWPGYGLTVTYPQSGMVLPCSQWFMMLLFTVQLVSISWLLCREEG